MVLTLIINSIVCLVGAVAGVLFAGGSVISIANMKVSWSGLLLVAALCVPGAFVVSGFSAWLAYYLGNTQFAVGLIAFPWVYGLLFVVLMLVSFKQ